MGAIVQGKYSPVMPITLLQSLLEYQDRHQDEDIVGDYFLVLAHDVLNHPEEYREIFQGRSHIPKSSFVILDNSVIELERPLGAEMLLEAADIVGPDCIILPDILGDVAGSLHLISKAHEVITSEQPDTPLLGVLQGRNVAELTRCAVKYSEFENIRYFGCPRWVANQLGTRKVFESILGIHHNGVFPNVHMLGMSTRLDDDIQCARLPGVMGIDSANPIVMGQLGIPLQRSSYKHHPREQQGFTYWKEKEVTPTTINNILTMRRWLDGSWQSVESV